MRYLALDANGDFSLNAPWLIDSPDCVRQLILTRLNLWKGEWFLDQTEGTPYNQSVLGKNYRGADAAIQARILATLNVTGISAYSSSYDGSARKLTINATVDTAFGEVALATVL